MKRTKRINEAQLKAIIAESVKNCLNEIDLLPNGIKNTPAKTAWMAISNALVNIQQVMKNREEEKVPDARSEENGRIHAIVPKDVEAIVDYIYTTIDNCLSNTFPNLRRPLKEIGETPQGQFAINAVKGRAAARLRYQNKQYGGMQAKAQQDAIINQAGDAAYNARKEVDPRYQNKDMDAYANAGYNYGYQKGMTN